jgi:hypothetical protein
LGDVVQVLLQGHGHHFQQRWLASLDLAARGVEEEQTEDDNLLVVLAASVGVAAWLVHVAVQLYLQKSQLVEILFVLPEQC